jgi:hypothetical protein
MSRIERLTAAGVVLGVLVAACAPPRAPESTSAAAAPFVSPLPAPHEVAPAPPSGAPGPSASPPMAAPAPAPATAASPARPSPSPSKPAAPANLTNDPLATQLLVGGSAALKTVVATPEKYRFQVLYSVVNEGPKPTLERHGFRADAEYYFPASSMKVPITLATYDRLATLRGAGHPALTRDATIRIHPVAGSAEPYTTTVARETWRALIVSDNFSANRLLGVVGHREAHETLWSLGLPSVRIHGGFATGAEVDPAELSPRVEFAVPGGASDELAARRSNLVPPATEATSLAIGKANIVDGRRVEGPLSFADKNAIRLRELQDTLVRIMRPDLLPAGAPADAASKDDLAYLRHTLGTLPSESGLAGYDRNVVADYTLSPFLRGIERVRARGHFEIFSKVGQAFGFLIANAYVIDKATGRSFFLVASVYANPDETMNDDTYGYDSISFPALADVGEAFCKHAFTP